ncbi:MAG: hypothetical protein HOY78_31175 [Saccharothrix sp.]|nr:hypothetical protein [Saccharothrix sp.]
MKRALLLIAAVLMALLGAVTANATPADHAGHGTTAKPAAGWTVTPAADFTTQALSCSAGNLCVWPVTDGSRNRCSWVNRDNDWWNTPVVCSWSSSSPVKAIYNNGTSSEYDGVCLYRGANYTSPEVWVPQGAQATNSTGVILRSHKWTRPSENC